MMVGLEVPSLTQRKSCVDSIGILRTGHLGWNRDMCISFCKHDSEQPLMRVCTSRSAPFVSTLCPALYPQNPAGVPACFQTVLSSHVFFQRALFSLYLSFRLLPTNFMVSHTSLSSTKIAKSLDCLRRNRVDVMAARLALRTSAAKKGRVRQQVSSKRRFFLVWSASATT